MTEQSLWGACTARHFRTKAEWLVARNAYVTASDAAACTMEHPYKTTDDVVAVKATGQDDFTGNALTWMGSAREANNIDIWGRCAGVQPRSDVDPGHTLLVSNEYPHLACTLDAWWAGDRERTAPRELWVDRPLNPDALPYPIEAKNVRSRSRSHWVKFRPGDPKSRLYHYWAQVQLQLLVTDMPFGVLFACVDAAEVYSHIIEADPAYHERLIAGAKALLDRVDDAKF